MNENDRTYRVPPPPSGAGPRPSIMETIFGSNDAAYQQQIADLQVALGAARERANGLALLRDTPIDRPTKPGPYWYTGPGFSGLTLVIVEGDPAYNLTFGPATETDRWRLVNRARGTWYPVLKPRGAG